MKAKLFDKVKLIDGRIGFIVDVHEPYGYEFEEVPFNRDNWVDTITSKQIEQILDGEPVAPHEGA